MLEHLENPFQRLILIDKILIVKPDILPNAVVERVFTTVSGQLY
jgi:hypothetical protein